MRAPLSKVRLEHLSRLGERRWNSRISAHVRFNTTTVSLSDEGSGAGGSGKMEGLAPRFFSFILFLIRMQTIGLVQKKEMKMHSVTLVNILEIVNPSVPKDWGVCEWRSHCKR